jgi:hypothetical protein
MEIVFVLYASTESHRRKMSIPVSNTADTEVETWTVGWQPCLNLRGQYSCKMPRQYSSFRIPF